MSTAPRFPSFDIVAHLGSGGMGEVYLARDLRLDRHVALKFISRRHLGDPMRRARFQREARILASLSHPAIAALHSVEERDGEMVLVLEHVPGESLRERIDRGALPWPEARAVASQVAEALAAAHDAGIVHRDVKPGNVRIRPDGAVKVLDFGIAKMLDQDEDEERRDPTLTGAATEGGGVLGTPGYLAPEQVRGAACDRRADAWAFGCLLFEMLAGRPAFPGATAGDRMAAVLKDQPDWSLLPSDVPPAARDVLRRTLVKDPDARLRDLLDVRLLLDESQPSPEAGKSHGRRAITLVVALVAAAAAGAGALAWTQPPSRPRGVEHLALALDALPPTTVETSIDISPDGNAVVYVGARSLLSVRDRRRAEEARFHVGLFPFFSPDGRWIAAFDDRLLKASAGGGPPVSLGPRVDFAAGGTWLADDTIVFAPTLGGPLMAVPATGGEAVPWTELDRAGGEASHRWPHALPDGSGVTYTVKTGAIAAFDEASIRVRRRGSDQLLFEGGSDGRITSSWHLLVAREGRLYAAAVDRKSLRLRGAPVAVASGIVTSPSTGRAAFAISEHGDLAYLAGPPLNQPSRLAWIEPDGDATDTGLEEPIHQASLSPDGTRVAFVRYGANDKIWIAHLSEGWVRQATFGPGNDHQVAWSPDGTRLAYVSDRTGRKALHVADASGAAPERALDTHGVLYFNSVIPTADGVLHLPGSGNGGTTEIWLAPWDGSPARPAGTRPERWHSAALSPDGRWLASVTTHGAAAVEAHPGPGERIVVPGGAGWIGWSADGRELLTSDGNGRVAAMSFHPEPRARVGPRRSLGLASDGFVALLDGRALVVRSPAVPTPSLRLVTGFFEILEREAPSEGGRR